MCFFPTKALATNNEPYQQLRPFSTQPSVAGDLEHCSEFLGQDGSTRAMKNLDVGDTFFGGWMALNAVLGIFFGWMVASCYSSSQRSFCCVKWVPPLFWAIVHFHDHGRKGSVVTLFQSIHRSIKQWVGLRTFSGMGIPAKYETGTKSFNLFFPGCTQQDMSINSSINYSVKQLIGDVVIWLILFCPCHSSQNTFFWSRMDIGVLIIQCFLMKRNATNTN